MDQSSYQDILSFDYAVDDELKDIEQEVCVEIYFLTKYRIFILIPIYFCLIFLG